MMKTYWVLGKKDNEEGKGEKLNPLQLQQKIKSMHKTPRRVTLPSTNVSLCDRLLLHQHLPTQARSYSIDLASGIPEYCDHHHSKRPSPAPDEWPELDKAIQATSSSPLALVPLESTPISTAGGATAKQGLDLRELSFHDVTSCPAFSEELRALLAERENDLSLDEYAKLAEENAQKARKLANWMAELASVAKKRENERSTSEMAEHRVEPGNCTIL